MSTNNIVNIKKNVTLANKTWFKTGGPARYFTEPTDLQEFADALAFAQQNNFSIFVLGQGANILVSDDGFDGLVICPQLLTVTIVEKSKDVALVQAGAGVTMDSLIAFCLDNNILGLEEFSGIPGTVGGSAYINLHYFQFLLAQFLTSATVINKQTGNIKIVDTNWFEFGYNQSKLHNKEYFLIDAIFKLKTANNAEVAFARGRRQEIIRHRTARYPSINTCGSFFRNFSEDEVTLISNNKKVIWIAYYLDKIGAKGTLSIGGATVSYQHANMIVNTGNATTADIIAVTKTMQQLVKKKFGITPQPECQLIGFNKYPLLQ